MEILWLIAIGVIAYLIGSVSSAIIVGRIFGGEDIRTKGSGNAGATNALRTYGKKAAAIVTVCDCLKAVAAILIAMLISNMTGLTVYMETHRFMLQAFALFWGITSLYILDFTAARVFWFLWLRCCLLIGG